MNMFPLLAIMVHHFHCQSVLCVFIQSAHLCFAVISRLALISAAQTPRGRTGGWHVQSQFPRAVWLAGWLVLCSPPERELINQLATTPISATVQISRLFRFGSSLSLSSVMLCHALCSYFFTRVSEPSAGCHG